MGAAAADGTEGPPAHYIQGDHVIQQFHSWELHPQVIKTLTQNLHSQAHSLIHSSQGVESTVSIDGGMDEERVCINIWTAIQSSNSGNLTICDNTDGL